MDLRLQRIDKGSDSTIGFISIIEGLMSWLECFTCEDQKQLEKVSGETRIPAGRYEIKLRNEGSMNGRYSDKFDWHQGMLWLQNVDNFEWVYIHIGNDHQETEGCILVGAKPNHDYMNGGGGVLSSVKAYERIYKKVVDALEYGPVFITVIDEV